MDAPIVGTSLGPYYYAESVQGVLRRAISTIQSEVAEPSAKARAHDVLNVLYTAMMFGAFLDWEPQPSKVISFPISEVSA